MSPSDWKNTQIVVETSVELYRPLELKIIQGLNWDEFIEFVEEAAKAQLALGAAA